MKFGDLIINISGAQSVGALPDSLPNLYIGETEVITTGLNLINVNDITASAAALSTANISTLTVGSLHTSIGNTFIPFSSGGVLTASGISWESDQLAAPNINATVSLSAASIYSNTIADDSYNPYARILTGGASVTRVPYMTDSSGILTGSGSFLYDPGTSKLTVTNIAATGIVCNAVKDSSGRFYAIKRPALPTDSIPYVDSSALLAGTSDFAYSPLTNTLDVPNIITTNINALSIVATSVSGTTLKSASFTVPTRILMVGASNAIEQTTATYSLESNSMACDIFQALERLIVDGFESSSSTSSGCATFAGGIGVGENLNIGGKLGVSDTTASTSTTTGCATFTGGLGISKNIIMGGKLAVNDTTASNSTTTGSATFAGGVGISGNLNIGGGTSIITTANNTAYAANTNPGDANRVLQFRNNSAVLGAFSGISFSLNTAVFGSGGSLGDIRYYRSNAGGNGKFVFSNTNTAGTYNDMLVMDTIAATFTTPIVASNGATINSGITVNNGATLNGGTTINNLLTVNNGADFNSGTNFYNGVIVNNGATINGGVSTDGMVSFDTSQYWYMANHTSNWHNWRFGVPAGNNPRVYFANLSGTVNVNCYAGSFIPFSGCHIAKNVGSALSESDHGKLFALSGAVYKPTELMQGYCCGQLCNVDRSKAVYGVIVDHNYIDQNGDYNSEVQVLSVGEGGLLVHDDSGYVSIECGDLIASRSDGYGRKIEDAEYDTYGGRIYKYVVARARETYSGPSPYLLAVTMECA